MPEVIMPKMGDAMEAGTVVRWLKQEGEEVSPGEPIAEIETDKVTLELEAEDGGTLAELYAGEGEEVPVGQPIAFIAGEGEEAPAHDGGRRREEGRAAEEEAGEEPEAPAATAAPPRDERREAERADGRFRASPLVRRLARENNLDLSRIQGTGPAGRIVERDVRAALERGEARAEERPPEEAAPAPGPTGAPGTTLREPSRMQRVIGERMQQAKREIPHFYATVEAGVDELLSLRRELNERLAEEGVKLSINDFVMKACAVALRKFPMLNALWTSEGIELHERVDLAMAVALEEGLITPVIRDAANKPLSVISAEAKDLASRAREGRLKPDEYQGGTFTVSNMGMFGVESFSAIINPPQAAIVAVSSIIRRPDFDEEGNVVPRSTMKLTLSADHRIANGADGARYMSEVKRLLENPMLLLV
ncbi:acetyltransferase component of pyruvate dehydrogenase complex [Rubrobacter xylanophilus]|uniref:Dihydrolipoamide acetyltransferase component of pyruvate dehydrogenase complex n=1 Tax=Rubrobacter xylanophilus TaxID=49319 RepID=A0A510HID8_9ACTN|nr:dihydrolipoamide acetyltransferase family protein [Rubrobacter xylanophilus]BBL79678.1 acetyltransferase component of pyruvate dehydrogenase complex [Rubrobacter xylanophilus]